MTTPRLTRRNHGKGHSYRLDEKRRPGVTTIIDRALPKPALIDWAARATAEAAVDRWDELGQLSPSRRLRELQQARWATTKAASLRGVLIHDYAEGLVHGRPVDVPAEHLGPVESVARFIDRWRIEPIATEAPVANTVQQYCGTVDGLFTFGGGDPVLLDWKTGGVFNEAALQAAGYVHCDLWQPNGPESEQPMPTVERAYIAKILSDDVQLLPVVDLDQLWLQFRYLLATWHWLQAVEDEPAIGNAIEPEPVR